MLLSSIKYQFFYNFILRLKMIKFADQNKSYRYKYDASKCEMSLDVTFGKIVNTDSSQSGGIKLNVWLLTNAGKYVRLGSVTPGRLQGREYYINYSHEFVIQPEQLKNDGKIILDIEQNYEKGGWTWSDQYEFFYIKGQTQFQLELYDKMIEGAKIIKNHFRITNRKKNNWLSSLHSAAQVADNLYNAYDNANSFINFIDPNVGGLSGVIGGLF